MKKAIIITLFTVLICTIAYTAGKGGSENDPLVTRKMTEDFINLNISDYITKKLEIIEETTLTSSIIYNKVNKTGFVQNDTIVLTPGTKIILSDGTVSLEGIGKIIDISDGREINNPFSLKPHVPYIVAENAKFTIKVTSLTAKISITGAYNYTNPYTVVYHNYAEALHSIGLFKGTNNGYELGRAATRIEALIMLIRLLGEEQQALEFTGTHPFNDVPNWANKYVAYAYDKGYTKGISTTAFGTSNYTKPEDYYTFVLRALKYQEGTDFTWKTASEKVQQLGLVTQTPTNFYRDFIAFVSYNSLMQKIHGTETTLAEDLIQKGIFTIEQYNNSKKIAQ